MKDYSNPAEVASTYALWRLPKVLGYNSDLRTGICLRVLSFRDKKTKKYTGYYRPINALTEEMFGDQLDGHERQVRKALTVLTSGTEGWLSIEERPNPHNKRHNVKVLFPTEKLLNALLVTSTCSEPITENTPAPVVPAAPAPTPAPVPVPENKGAAEILEDKSLLPWITQELSAQKDAGNHVDSILMHLPAAVGAHWVLKELLLNQHCVSAIAELDVDGRVDYTVAFLQQCIEQITCKGTEDTRVLIGMFRKQARTLYFQHTASTTAVASQPAEVKPCNVKIRDNSYPVRGDNKQVLHHNHVFYCCDCNAVLHHEEAPEERIHDVRKQLAVELRGHPRGVHLIDASLLNQCR